MSPFFLAFKAITVLFIVLFTIGGTFLCVFFERMLSARLQHRDGPGIGGKVDLLQVWKDFRKVRSKERAPSTAGRKTMISFWASLPILFLVVLFGGILPGSFRDAGILALVFLLLLSVAMEAMLLHFTGSDRERLDWRGPLLLKVLGISSIAFCSAAVAMRAGSSDLPSLSSFQLKFPFHSMFMSPGLLFLGLACFASIYVVTGDTPIGDRAEKGLSGSLQYLIFYVRRMWSFCLIVFWVDLFFGGAAGFLPKVLFPVKAVFFLFLYVLLQVSVPVIRSSDAGALSLRWLMTFGFIGFALEVIWMGYFL